MTQPARILMTDTIAANGRALLHAHPDLAVTVRPGITHDELCREIVTYDGLIVRSTTRVTAAVLEAATALKVIGRAGVGVANIDVEAATRQGIVVMHTPVGNTNAAAEHTMALLLALSRYLPQAAMAVRAGHWERGAFLGTEITGTVLGIIGFGRIGRLVARKAQALGMHPVACDPFVAPEVAQDLGVALLDLPDLLRQADYLTLPTPSQFPEVAASVTPRPRQMGSEVRCVLPGEACLLCAGGLVHEAAARRTLATWSPVRATPATVPWHQQRAGSLRTLNRLAAHLGVQMWLDLVAGRLDASCLAQMEFSDTGHLRVGYPTVALPETPARCVLCTKAGLGDAGLGWLAL